MIRNIDGHTDWVKSLAYIRNTNLFVSGGYDNYIKIWYKLFDNIYSKN
jgi:WD40 repeat protein